MVRQTDIIEFPHASGIAVRPKDNRRKILFDCR